IMLKIRVIKWPVPLIHTDSPNNYFSDERQLSVEHEVANSLTQPEVGWDAGTSMSGLGFGPFTSLWWRLYCRNCTGDSGSGTISRFSTCNLYVQHKVLHYDRSSYSPIAQLTNNTG